MALTNEQRWERLRKLLRDGDGDGLRAFVTELQNFPPAEAGVASAMKAQLDIALGKHAPVRKKLLAAAKTRTLSKYESLVLGLLQLDAGDASSAGTHLEAAKKGGLKDPRIFSGLGRLALADGKNKVAKGLFEQALKGDEKNFHARWSLGIAEVRLGDLEKAFEAFSRASNDCPSFESALLDSVRVAVKMGHAEKVFTKIEAAAARPNASPRVRMAYADSLLAMGRLMKAVDVLAPLTERSKDAGFLMEFAKLAAAAGKKELAKSVRARAGTMKKPAPKTQGAKTPAKPIKKGPSPSRPIGRLR